MSVTQPDFEIGRRPGRWRPLAPVATACACAAGLAYVYANNPTTPGTAFISCPLYTTTGIWCPGCGLTRATHRMLHGDLFGAMSYNALLPLVVILAVAGWWTWMRAALGRPLRRSIATLRPWVWTAVLSTLIVFGVVRNLPFSAARALAP